MISKVDSEKIDEMIQDYIDGNPRKYRQAYYVASNSQVIAVDDSDGECFTGGIRFSQISYQMAGKE